MTITAGMLYQESTQRLCNAYLWDDQAITGRTLVGASLVLAGMRVLYAAGLSNGVHPIFRGARTFDYSDGLLGRGQQLQNSMINAGWPADGGDAHAFVPF